MIYSKSELQKALFFEIAAKSKNFENLSKNNQEIWETNFHPRLSKNETLTVSETYEKHSKFVPEFAEIISVTLGVVDEKMAITVVSTESKGEAKILKELADFMNGHSDLIAAGYNLTNHSIPFLIKRMIINRQPLPFHLKLKGKKPWEVNLIDVMKDYQGTVFESLKLETLCNTLGVNYEAYEEENPTVSCEKYLSSVIHCAIKMSY